MAPNKETVEWQTTEIIKYLFSDDEEPESRRFDADLECDGPGDKGDDFDPVEIADKLRSVADALNDDVNFRAALTDLKKAAAKEAAEQAFSHGVEAICQTPVLKSAEVAAEVQLIRASAAFGLYVIKLCPELKNTVSDVMNTFLNRRVGTWVTKQGGWNKVNV